MMARPRPLGRTHAAICQFQLDALVEKAPQVRGALVSTVDGFDVAANVRKPLSPARLSAMASSLLALGEAVSSESDTGICKDIVIDASDGRVLIMDVPFAAQKLLLTVLSDSAATLGQILWAARDCRNEIIRQLGSA